MELCKAQLDIEVRRVPGHCGITGNKKADAMARAVLASKAREENLSRPECIREEFHEDLTFAALKHHVTIRIQKLTEDWWEKNKTDRYEDLDLMMRRKRLPELALPRWSYHRLIAARSGHGDFAS